MLIAFQVADHGFNQALQPGTELGLAAGGELTELGQLVQHQAAGVFRIEQQAGVFQHQTQQWPAQTFNKGLDKTGDLLAAEQMLGDLLQRINGITGFCRETDLLFGQCFFDRLAHMALGQAVLLRQCGHDIGNLLRRGFRQCFLRLGMRLLNAVMAQLEQILNIGIGLPGFLLVALEILQGLVVITCGRRCGTDSAVARLHAGSHCRPLLTALVLHAAMTHRDGGSRSRPAVTEGQRNIDLADEILVTGLQGGAGDLFKNLECQRARFLRQLQLFQAVAEGFGHGAGANRIKAVFHPRIRQSVEQLSQLETHGCEFGLQMGRSHFGQQPVFKVVLLHQ